MATVDTNAVDQQVRQLISDDIGAGGADNIDPAALIGNLISTEIQPLRAFTKQLNELFFGGRRVISTKRDVTAKTHVYALVGTICGDLSEESVAQYIADKVKQAKIAKKGIIK